MTRWQNFDEIVFEQRYKFNVNLIFFRSLYYDGSVLSHNEELIQYDVAITLLQKSQKDKRLAWLGQHFDCKTVSPLHAGRVDAS